MKKIQLFLFFNVITFSAFTMEKKTSNNSLAMEKETSNNSVQKIEEKPNTIEVSIVCAQNIERINEDGSVLYYFFKGVFKGMSERAPETERPSCILKFLASGGGNINQNTQLKHMCATDYLTKIINPHCDTFDKDFTEYLNQKNNPKEAWLWFADYFKKKGLEEPFFLYKNQLIEKEKKSKLTNERKLIDVMKYYGCYTYSNIK